MKKILVTGAGGFIGGHLVKELINRGHKIRATDIKPFDDWYQYFEEVENFNLDMTVKENCFKATEGVDEVINMACNMGGMGFIENNKALCMLSVLVNTHMLMACKEFKIKKYFFSSSACAYNTELQQNTKIIGLKESDAYPAMPEDGYGWEKLFSERMCRHFHEDYNLDVKVARYHNIFGPNGTYDGGREKAPAALCRKVIDAIRTNKDVIDVWGDGEQTRSFLYIEDCIDATLKLIDSKETGPINIGSEEQVSINQMLDKIEVIAEKKIKRKYLLDKPKGVRGRSSDNTMIKEKLDWEPKFSLSQGLEKTYFWIKNEMNKNS
ncbi:NAD-dependent epimerase/dehydratase family protein [Pelagibacteraceae bacterium]|jgi:GDP-D-mannose 3', 5'-epimerase|nr:NAD-dependent epimerase/dehydratase family protein [Pelagibacteraceae bacterium]